MSLVFVTYDTSSLFTCLKHPDYALLANVKLVGGCLSSLHKSLIAVM